MCESMLKCEELVHDGGYPVQKHLDHLGSQLWGIRHAQPTH